MRISITASLAFLALCAVAGFNAPKYITPHSAKTMLQSAFDEPQVVNRLIKRNRERLAERKQRHDGF